MQDELQNIKKTHYLYKILFMKNELDINRGISIKKLQNDTCTLKPVAMFQHSSLCPVKLQLFFGCRNKANCPHVRPGPTG